MGNLKDTPDNNDVNLNHLHGKESKRILYFDMLTIVSCFAVIALHCNALAHDYAYSTARWPIALFFEVIFYWAVNVFFMLTGANNMLYRRKRTTKEFLSRRLKKLAIPWITWSIVVYVIRYADDQGYDPRFLLDLLHKFFGGGIEGVYWFFPAIISLTMIMPLLSKLVDYRNTLWYFVGLSFFFLSILGPLQSMLNIKIDMGITMPMLWYPMMLATLGHLISTQEVQKRYRIAVYILAVLALAFRYVSTFVLSTAAGETVKLTWGYGSFVGVLPAVALFLLFKYHDWENGFFSQHAGTVAKVSSCAFGIYLVHNIILSDVIKGLLGVDKASLWLMLLGPFVVFVLSLAVVLLLKRVSFLRWTVP